ncbi:MAG: hypothetical protein RIB45_05905 [Marivibrio sp.]|uniref:hypothetical protein n=1 Tax=Marivibrio sp. TaxID=2039719 RepID=UPI0032EFACE7
MSFEEYEAELGLLLTELEGEQGDEHEIMMRLKQMLDQMRAEGLPIPDDLKRFEQELDERFTREGGGG